MLFILMYGLLNISAYAYQQDNVAVLTKAQVLIDANLYQQAADVLEKGLMFDSSDKRLFTLYQAVLVQLNKQSLPRTQHIDVLDKKKMNWHWQRQLKLMFGGGSNLNKAPMSNKINLTLPSGLKSLELAGAFQKKSGYGLEVSAGLGAEKYLTSRNYLSLGLQFAHRNTSEHNFTDYYRIAGQAHLKHRLSAKQQWEIHFSIDALQYDNQTRFYHTGVLARYLWRPSQYCQAAIAPDLQWQLQTDGSTFSKLYAGALTQVKCYWHKSLYSVDVKIGNQWALIEHAGGDQIQIALILTSRTELSLFTAKDQWKNYINVYYGQDEKGYSPFLAYGAKKNTQRLSLGSQYRLPISKAYENWYVILKMEWQKQFSNLSLFEFSALEGWVGTEVLW